MIAWQRALGIDLEVSDDFGNWFAGFVDGEGSFVIQKATNEGRAIACTLVIRLRDDDKDILYEIQNILDTGTICQGNNEHNRQNGINSKDQTIWKVKKTSDIIHIIIPLFEKYPLRAKKRHDFRIWARAARLIHAKLHLTDAGREEVLRLKDELTEVRRYKG